MTSDREGSREAPDLARVREVFSLCVELDDEGREKKLLELCPEDAAFRHEIRELLAFSSRTSGSEPASPAAPSGSVERGAALPASGEWIGPYRIDALLAEGGMGAVFRATQEEPLHREVAVKVIKEGLSSKEFLDRFERERQSLARMQHENIASVFDAGTTNSGQPFFVMEHVCGDVLIHYCDERKLTVMERLEVFQRVCHGVQHAHQRGVLHRDLKPGNVLVVDREEGPVPKIIDFGLARAVQANGPEESLLTRDGGLVGTPAYMSPEQASGSDDLDVRSDVFSLGVILYELLTGELPFAPSIEDRPGLLEMQRRIVNDDPDKPSTRISKVGKYATTHARCRGTTSHLLRRRLRGDLDWIVMRALEKDRDRRYGSAHELSEDVARHLRREPVHAGPPSVGYRARKFCSRHRLAVSAGVLAVASLVGGTAASVWSMLDAQESQRKELGARLREERRSYLANMAAATYAIESGNVEEALRMLIECPENQRGFEWRHLSARLEATGRACVRVLEGHSDTVMRVAFIPRSDEFVTASADGTVRVWDPEMLEPRYVIEAERLPPASGLPNDGVMGMAVSEDGRWVLTGHMSGTAVLRRTGDGAEHARVKASGSAVGVGFSPDGTEFIVADSRPISGADYRIRSFDVKDGEEVRSWTRHGRSEVFGLAGSHDNRRRLEGGRDLAKIVDAFTGEELVNFAAEGATTTVDWSFDDSMVLTCGAGSRSCQLVDASTGEILARLRVTDSDIHTASFTADPNVVLTGDVRGQVRVWDVALEEVRRTLAGHARPVQSIAYDWRSGRVLTGSEDWTARLWSLDGVRAFERIQALPLTVDRLAVRPDAKAFAAVSLRGVFTVLGPGGEFAEESMPFAVWDPGTPLPPAPKERVLDVKWSPVDNERMAFAYLPSGKLSHKASGRLMLWDTSSEESLVAETGEQLWTICYSADGSRVFCVGVFGTVTSVDSASAEVLGSWPIGGGRGISRILLDADGDTGLVVVLMDEVVLFDTTTGEVLCRIAREEGSIHDAVFGPNGECVYITEEEDIVVRDRETGAVGARWEGHRGTIRGLALSPDGSRLASAGADQTVRLWDPADGSCVLILRDPDAEVKPPIFFADGSGIATGDTKGKMYVWRDMIDGL